MTEEDIRALQDVRALPFVLDDGQDISFWEPAQDGFSSDDIALGESYANFTLRLAKAVDHPLLIAMIMRDMVSAGRFTGVEAGFIATIASAARFGAMN